MGIQVIQPHSSGSACAVIPGPESNDGVQHLFYGNIHSKSQRKNKYQFGCTAVVTSTN
jgi:hypothetical protein